MVSDICTSLAEKNVEIGLLTYSGITSSIEYKNIQIIAKQWGNIFENFKFIGFVKYMLEAKNEIGDFSSKKEIVLSALFKTHFLKKVEAYDIINFHGITPNNIYFINHCIKNGIKVIVTLHGLNSFDENILYSEEKCRMEKDFISFAYKYKIPVVVISEGIRLEILRYLDVESSDNFKVIMNGCNLRRQSNNKLSLILRSKYKISNKDKVILCVGNFSKNKNQYQVVKAFLLLPDEIKKDVKILFVGEPFGDARVQALIEENDLRDQLIVCGAVKKESVSEYYNIANYTVLASKYEGFGLSIIEGFSYGLPNLTFSDLGAVSALYDENAMIKINSRENHSLSHGVQSLLVRDWDRKKVILHSKKFSLKQMANTYKSLYKYILVR